MKRSLIKLLILFSLIIYCCEDNDVNDNIEEKEETTINIEYGEHDLNKTIGINEVFSFDLDNDNVNDFEFSLDLYVQTRECLNSDPEDSTWQDCPDEKFYTLSLSIKNDKFFVPTIEGDGFYFLDTVNANFTSTVWNNRGLINPYYMNLPDTVGYLPFKRIQDSINVQKGWVKVKIEGANNKIIFVKYAINQN